MKTIVAVPMKSLSRAKSRLAARLDSDQRSRVALDLFIRGQRFLMREFPELDRVVVTPSMDVARVACRYNATVLAEKDGGSSRDRESGLNRAAARALEYARQAAYDWLIIQPGDIPHLVVREFEQLLSKREGRRATIVASRDGGTNALLIPVNAIPAGWSFGFGVSSARQHQQTLSDSGLAVTQLQLRALSFDVDTVDDYVQFMTWWNGDDAPPSCRGVVAIPHPASDRVGCFVSSREIGGDLRPGRQNV
jgi:2-phospho-L-lactate guanylyltransferase